MQQHLRPGKEKEQLDKLLEEILDENLSQIIMSNSKDPSFGTKMKIRPVVIKGELLFQAERFAGNQVFHENLTKTAAAEQIQNLMQTTFRQCEIAGGAKDAIILVSKKGKATIKVKNHPMAAGKALQHNREKQYVLQEGKPVDFLVGLGVQTPDGKVTKNRFDKFRQINRYLEFIEDILPQLPKDRKLQIIDFGCGKSYLTFAMYYYLHEMQGYNLQIVGLDLKKDVIKHCNELAASCGYTDLHFQVGDISSYEGCDAVDMVVSLHACDTATDYALEKAVKWGARVIMAVPCCQHEVNKQIDCEALEPVLGYGLIRERISALMTDAIRARLLEQQGYETQIVEFIDMEHTPKNLMIRAVKKAGADREKGASIRSKVQVQKAQSLEEMLEMLHIDPTLKKLL